MMKKSVFFNLLMMIFLVSGLTFPFFGGMFSNETNLEKISDYAAKVVQSNTENKKYVTINVGKSKDGSSLPQADVEFYNLYGVFRQTKVTFANSINAERNHDMKIVMNETTLDSNLSAFYVGPIGTIQYNEHYKHQVYPIEVMFGDVRMYDISEYVAYLSQSQADFVLEQKGELKGSNGNYSKEQYKSLLKTIVPISIDDNPYNFVVQNIYYESNYYYEGLRDVIGDFIMVSYFMPLGLRNESQNMYFMSEYGYQNRYFMKYIKNVYSTGEYSVTVNRYNIQGEIDDNYMLSFYYGDSNASSTNWVYTTFVILSFAFITLSLSIYLLSPIKQEIINHIFTGFSLFLPYVVFSIIYTNTSDVTFLSRSAVRIYTIVTLIFIFLYLVATFIKCSLIKNKKKKRD